MLDVLFYHNNEICHEKLSYAVIVARYKNNWVFVRHNERTTWEIPGGRREPNEDIKDTAKRELFEETGATKFRITPICIYSVKTEVTESFGMLFMADIEELGPLPNLEISEITYKDKIPENNTYPQIQPLLFEKVTGREFNYANRSYT